MNNDKNILRGLAFEYLALLNTADNHTAYKLQKAVNDNKMIRPVVLIDEVPWHEMNIDNQLTLCCEDEFLKSIEQTLRRKIYQYKYFPADMVLLPYISVQKVIESTGNGVGVDENVLDQGNDNNIVAHEYNDQFENDEDIEKLKNPIITYNEGETMRRFNLVSEMIADILPVRITGVQHVSNVIWDDISRYRGVSALLMDMIDRPEFSHALVRRLTDIKIDEMLQMEKLRLFDSEPTALHCTSMPVSDLDLPSGVDERTLKNVWGRGAAQIFASVGNDMHDEFDIEYMKETMGMCGLTYYGCCEPLDRKMDIVEKLPNLRKVSITPWANINVAAEAISGKYVIASKPNPSSVAVGNLDKDNLKSEIKTILDACKKYNCTFEMTLKDISTAGGNPNNIFEWEKIVMDMVRNY